MYVEHPYKFNDKFYAKVDGKFYEITKEVAKAMLSAYRNEVYRSKMAAGRPRNHDKKNKVDRASGLCFQ